MNTYNNDENIIEGKNSVIEALKSSRPIDKIFIQKGSEDKALAFIASNARNAGIPISECDRKKLDFMSNTHAHQGVIATVATKELSSVSDILQIAKDKGEDPFIVLCDGIEDPRNLGAIIRSSECAGVHGVIISKYHSAGLGSATSKSSAGALEHMSVAKVSNLTSTIKDLKAAGLWIYGAEANGNASLWKAEMKGPICLVIGSEGNGISRLVRENCDFIIQIPMFGQVNSLNASVAASILLYEVLRQRK